jgi:hypothetical protein
MPTTLSARPELKHLTGFDYLLTVVCTGTKLPVYPGGEPRCANRWKADPQVVRSVAEKLNHSGVRAASSGHCEL